MSYIDRKIKTLTSVYKSVIGNKKEPGKLFNEASKLLKDKVKPKNKTNVRTK